MRMRRGRERVPKKIEPGEKERRDEDKEKRLSLLHQSNLCKFKAKFISANNSTPWIDQKRESTVKKNEQETTCMTQNEPHTETITETWKDRRETMKTQKKRRSRVNDEWTHMIHEDEKVHTVTGFGSGSSSCHLKNGPLLLQTLNLSLFLWYYFCFHLTLRLTRIPRDSPLTLIQ